MALTLLLGGARSGKSRLAELLTPGSDPVTLIATAEARDAEMQDRIIRHQKSRPGHWSVIEEPVELERALAHVSRSRRVDRPRMGRHRCRMSGPGRRAR